jgi:homopolymeric O-antigen transport system ATP-binding protein
MATASDICVSVRGVSKKFSRSLKRSFVYGARDIGRALLGKGEDASLQRSEFWAVRNVSFELQRGQSIGVIGLNGSGKTTLMRMVSGILRPTQGSIQVNGRIAPMLALGAGFKPVLSGRENIFLNLSLLGVAPQDIRDRFDSIVNFAELWESIDAAIGTYSSGMLARLGFACAVHTDPQILVVDEILSVGDTRFRMKCRNKINELRKAGTSMLLVSHSTILIETLSDECLYLRHGNVAAFGPPADVIKAYQADTVKSSAENAVKILTTPSEAQDKKPTAVASIKTPSSRQQAIEQDLKISQVRFVAAESSEAGIWLTGKAGEMQLTIDCLRSFEQISINLMIFDLEHQPGEVVQFIMSNRDFGWLTLSAGPIEICLSLPAVGLRAGTYRIKISISQGDMHDILDAFDELKLIVRDNNLATNSLYFQPRDWLINGQGARGTAVVLEESNVEDIEEF